MASLETGKSRTESILEVQEAIDLIETYAGHMEENDGYAQPLDSFVEGERNADVLRPYGVFGVIAPFNFPVALVDRHGRLGADRRQHGGVQAVRGDARRRARRSARSCSAAGLPAGVVQPRARRAGHRAARSWTRDVDGVAFTGSAEVGREIARKLQDGPYARPGAHRDGRQEPGDRHRERRPRRRGRGRRALRLRPRRARSAAPARARSSSDSVHDEFVERLAARARRAARSATRATAAMFVGPVINEAQRGRATRRAVARGARATGASPPAAGGPTCPGHFVEPTVVADLPHGHALERDELFLPFVTVTRVGSFDEALAEANAPVYGLTAGIFTGDEAEKERFLDEIQAGVVYVNRRAGRDDRRVAGHADVLRLEVERLDRQGRAGRRGTCRSSCASRAGQSWSELREEGAEGVHVAVHRALVVRHAHVPLLLAAGGRVDAAVHQPEPDQLGPARGRRPT